MRMWHQIHGTRRCASESIPRVWPWRQNMTKVHARRPGYRTSTLQASRSLISSTRACDTRCMGVNPRCTGRCEERWLPGPTVAPNSRGRRGQRAEQRETGLVLFTTNMSFLSRSIRGVSCLPGARPGGGATQKCEASCSCKDRVQGATVARALPVRPSCSAATPLIDECYVISCVDFQARKSRWIAGVQGANRGQW
jgi:hypothetical protein